MQILQAGTSLYYVDRHYIVMDDPETLRPCIIKRSAGEATSPEINAVLKQVKMSLTRNSIRREDGLWCCELIPEGEANA